MLTPRWTVSIVAALGTISPMIAIFCLRLGWGLTASLLVVLTSPINPRFFRTHLLISVALLAVACYFIRDDINWPIGLTIGLTILLGFLGAIVWMLEGAPGGRLLILAVGALWTTLFFQLPFSTTAGAMPPALQMADHFLSGAVLGSVTTAMLMGHLYLIAPSMSLAPLVRLLIVAGLALGLRMAAAAWSVWLWKENTVGAVEMETWLWLGVRWGVGFLIPLVLLWLAWETTRIRSTQSATGILYVVVIVVFLGELTSQLLLHKTNCVL